MSELVAQTKTLVLNVNDSDAMRLAISAMLKQAGFEVLEAATGEGALPLIEAHEPHLVVLDVNLPGANGFEICRLIRKNPCRSTMRILHTSAMSVSLEDKIESLESGADGFLEQPFELSAVLSSIRSLLDLGQAGDPIASLPTAAAAAAKPRTDHVVQLLEHVPDGVFCLDTAWRFTFVNAVAEQVLGRARSELLGKTLWHAFPALEASVFGQSYRRAMVERVIVTLDGLRSASNAALQARALPTPEGLVVLFQDASVARVEPAPELRRNDEATFVRKRVQRVKTLRGL